MSGWDHAFVFVAVVLSPLYSLWGYRQLESALAGGAAGARMREYLETIVLLWVFGLGAVALWMAQGRPLAAIGLAAPRGWPVLPGLAISAAVVWFLSAQLARVKRSTRRPVVGIDRVEDVRALLPESPRELRAFIVAALSAGVFEEILYRGYLIAYLESFMPLWAAVTVSAVAFAYGHVYQGFGNLPKIFVLSMAFAGVYLWTGSLLIPILLHAFIDIVSVLTARAALSKPGDIDHPATIRVESPERESPKEATDGEVE